MAELPKIGETWRHSTGNTCLIRDMVEATTLKATCGDMIDWYLLVGDLAAKPTEFLVITDIFPGQSIVFYERIPGEVYAVEAGYFLERFTQVEVTTND